MFNRKTLMTTVVLCILACVIGACVSYAIFNNIPDVSNSELSDLIESSQTNEEGLVLEKSVEDEEEVATASTEEKITPSTKIVYQYYYVDDDIMEEQEEVPTYFLLDLTLDDMLKYYKDWEIISFSSSKVVMRKNVEGESRQRYIIGEKDGYVAVFYEQEQDGISLHEITETPISTLPVDEQANLKEGIFILGDDKLAEAMQNYGS